MEKHHLHLTSQQEAELVGLLKAGQLGARVYKRMQAMLLLHEGNTLEAVSAIVKVSNDTVRAWRNRYQAEGSAGILQEKPRSGRPIEIDGLQRATITALACSPAPSGYARWTLRLLADRSVELGYCPQLSHQWVGEILKKTKLNLT
jgi:putative transposase